jgi:hypothetical protein
MQVRETLVKFANTLFSPFSFMAKQPDEASTPALPGGGTRAGSTTNLVSSSAGSPSPSRSSASPECPPRTLRYSQSPMDARPHGGAHAPGVRPKGPNPSGLSRAGTPGGGHAKAPSNRGPNMGRSPGLHPSPGSASASKADTAAAQSPGQGGAVVAGAVPPAAALTTSGAPLGAGLRGEAEALFDRARLALAQRIAGAAQRAATAVSAAARPGAGAFPDVDGDPVLDNGHAEAVPVGELPAMVGPDMAGGLHASHRVTPAVSVRASVDAAAWTGYSMSQTPVGLSPEGPVGPHLPDQAMEGAAMGSVFPLQSHPALLTRCAHHSDFAVLVWLSALCLLVGALFFMHAHCAQ